MSWIFTTPKNVRYIPKGRANISTNFTSQKSYYSEVVQFSPLLTFEVFSQKEPLQGNLLQEFLTIVSFIFFTYTINCHDIFIEKVTGNI